MMVIKEFPNINFYSRNARILYNAKKHKKCIVWGIGGTLSVMLSEGEIRLDEIEFFIDTYKTGMYHGKKIYSPTILKEINPEEYLIIIPYSFVDDIVSEISNYTHHDNCKWHVFVGPAIHMTGKERSIKAYINEKNLIMLKRMFEIEKNSEQEIEDKLEMWKYKLESLNYIPRIVLELTNVCTLKCKECCAQIPYEKKHWVEDFEIIKQSIEGLLKIVDGVLWVDCIGGEAFLHPEFNKILQYLCSKDEIMNVEIITNATVKLDDSIIETLKNEKIYLEIDDYKTKKSRAEEYEDICKKHGIKYTCMNLQNWIKLDELELKKTADEVRDELEICNSYWECKSIVHGQLYPCGRNTWSELYCGKAPCPVNLLDINQDNLAEKRNELLNQYSRNYMEICEDCAFGGGYYLRSCVPGEQIN